MEFRAQPGTPALPALLRAPQQPGAAHPAGVAAVEDDRWMPPGYLRAHLSLAVACPSDAPLHTLDPDTVPADAPDGRTLLALVLADGSTWLTTAARLGACLNAHHPTLADADGVWRLDRLTLPNIPPAGPRPSDAPPSPVIAQVHVAIAGGLPPELDRLVDAIGHGAQALVRAIEAPLAPGLYRWDGRALGRRASGLSTEQPMLVFIHDLGADTAGSFAELASRDRVLWAGLERRYSGGIWALEHRTLSDSPLRNAIDLVDALPVGARVSLVTHGRGGLVGDLLCLRDIEAVVAQCLPEDEPATAAQRALMHTLASRLGARQPVVQRYVRIASPAAGSLWLDEHPDLFLSLLLGQVGQVPQMAGRPVHTALRRAVIELVARQIDLREVPGLEALLPAAPLARLLLRARVQAGIDMAVIAGDTGGGSLLHRLGASLSDCLRFDQSEHDLLIGTDAMLGGVAAAADAQVLLDRGRQVGHWRYFTNDSTRRATCNWLLAAQPRAEPGWTPLTGPPLPEPPATGSRSAAAPRAPDRREQPVVLLLPGLMGSHLRGPDGQRTWFDPQTLPLGGLPSITWSRQQVEAESLFDAVHADLAAHLAATHRVETFPYDWRQPLDVLADRLGERLTALLRETDRPLRLLAHGLGGLVVRACIHRRRAVVDELMQRNGARLVLLGTPHHGTHAAVEALLGKSAALRGLVWRDTAQPMDSVLGLLAEFRGLLQLLPRRGFDEEDAAHAGNAHEHPDFQRADTWAALRRANRDRWFGDGRGALPSQRALDEGSWLWHQTTESGGTLPPAYTDRTVAVHGIARLTPCGLRIENGRLQMVGTTRGDGTVTWASGHLDGIGRHYYLAAEHGELTTCRDGFPALTELLERGTTRLLPGTPPVARDATPDVSTRYDAGPPEALDTALLMRGLSGGTRRPRRPAVQAPRLPTRSMTVQVRAGDLRFVSTPLMVGHYEHDPIAGPQLVVDRELLDGALSERYRLGLYAGPRGSATVVLSPPNDTERRRGSLRGAIVVGLGRYDGALGARELTESVRTGALRYLMQAQDVLGSAERALSLSTLLIGYNSSLNLTVAASVEALVRGVLEANQRFAETARARLHIERLEIVELYIDTAISAVHALRDLSATLARQARLADLALHCQTRLVEGDGLRPRLADTRSASYWPRLIVTDARDDDPCTRSTPVAPRTDADPPARAEPGRPRMADCLKFLYVGQRARAESVVQQRQPGLIEAIVQQHNGSPVWNEHIGRMLFHLMVPNDFKDTARQLERIVLVVDDTTANVPWELLYAPDPDDEKTCVPLSLRTPVVRQLDTTQYRSRVRQSPGRSVLMIGNPSVRGFSTGFRGRDGSALADPIDLPGAEAEARALTQLMEGLGHTVVPLIGPEAATATQVLGSLLGQPFRFVHISAHGVHQLQHRDGALRSGVVLSDGLLITAAEIEAMEAVPELVFLNCCHLGVVVGGTPQGNRLAASLAQHLIGIGVRCVVVAGWAVDDALAAQFGQVFYEALLRDNQPFGEAVFRARKALWDTAPDNVTWGAFQAYGDPAWQAEAGGSERGNAPATETPPASVEELLDELSRHSAQASRRICLLDPGVLAAQRTQLATYIAQRVPPEWQDDPVILSALGTTWAELDAPEQACLAYRAALQREDLRGRVPVRAIEQLALMEARWGERSGNPGLVRQALRRLNGVRRVIGLHDRTRMPDSPDHCAMVGGSQVHLASLHAAHVLRHADNPALIRKDGLSMLNALQAAINAYTQAEGGQGTRPFSPFHAINRLSLDAITPWENEEERMAARRLATEAGEVAERQFGTRDNFWNAVMVPEARLAEVLLDGELGRPDTPVRDDLRRAYQEALSNLTVKPRQIDAVMARLRTLSCLFDAMVLFDAGGSADAQVLRHWWTAEHLLTLCEGLLPGSQPRRDRPPRPPRPLRPPPVPAPPAH